jgi:type III secretory pathway component EscU
MISLKLNQTVLYRPAAGQLGFQMSAQLLQIDLMRINALDNCHLFSISSLLNFDYDPLLLLGNLLADA